MFSLVRGPRLTVLCLELAPEKNGKKWKMLRFLPHVLVKNKAWLLLSGCDYALPCTFSSYLYERGLWQKGSCLWCFYILYFLSALVMGALQGLFGQLGRRALRVLWYWAGAWSHLCFRSYGFRNDLELFRGKKRGGCTGLVFSTEVS